MMEQKKMWLHVVLAVLVITWLGTSSVLAEETATASPEEGVAVEEQIAGEDELVPDEAVIEEVDKPVTNVNVSPRVAYNAVEKWRVGLNVMTKYILGSDQLRVWGDYSFSTKHVNGALEYQYHLGVNNLYGSLMSNTRSFGLFDNTMYYQHERAAMLGGSRTYSDGSISFMVDLRAKLIERTPILFKGPDQGFETGTDLYIQPALIGAYKGYQGKLKLDYSIPTGISDYDYYKVNALIQKGFKLTSSDRLIVAGEAGILRGDYPKQVQFHLGSAPGNITPNFWSKIFGVGQASELSGEPFVYLHGYEDNAFSGNNVYVGKLEYQRKLSSRMPYGVYPVAKVFATVGNAFDGSWSEGLHGAKAAVGVGLNLESVLENPSSEQNWYMGVNLAKGFGDKSAFTLGFDIGVNLDLLPMLLMQ